MAVVNPVKLVIENYPDDKEEWLETENNPEDENAGTRQVPFSKELYIEREDFQEEADKKFFRLKLGGEVRLKAGYIIKAERVEKDEKGQITTIFATYDEDSRSGSGTEASLRKVKGTLHWVSAKHACQSKSELMKDCSLRNSLTQKKKLIFRICESSIVESILRFCRTKP
jgi:glutaminyl-tRNA synthetase